jgi:hypothetical protein
LYHNLILFGVMTEKLFLGLDSSTQTLKVTVIDEQLKEVYVKLINFDVDLPQFGTYLFVIVIHFQILVLLFAWGTSIWNVSFVINI